jgi:hypothetical protein
MTMNLWRQFVKYWRAEVFSPRGFLLRAAVIGAGFLAVHLAGLRDYTSVLNGTVGPGSANWRTSSILGVAYLIIYLAFVFVAPVLVLASGLLAVWQRRLNRK